MKITINGNTKEYAEGARIIDFLSLQDKKKYICAKVNNRIRELDYKVNVDSNVEFLDLTDNQSMIIYQSSLRYLFAMAVKRIYPDVELKIVYAMSRAFLALFSKNGNFQSISPKMVEEIEAEMKKLIELDIPITRSSMTIEEAKKIYNELGYKDKALTINYRPEPTVHLYQCGDYANYMFSYMVPSTGYLSLFKLRLYYPGLLIQYPRAELGGIIPEFEDAINFGQTLAEEYRWGKVTGADAIWKINKLIEDKKEVEFINLCETRHNNMLAELGLNILKEKDRIKLICVAGPSSSGKTTFTNRLKVELLSRGIKPLMISIDNYYKNPKEAPKDEFGKPDLEHIEALDIKQFDDNMYRLINGEEVTLPIYNFKTGMQEPGETVRLEKDQMIMIEGIHALNDTLTPSISLSNKYKIFIAPQLMLAIDGINPISITDVRLVRRLVRDYKYRNASPEETLSMWASVRRGEFRWIYPYQEDADYVYNSELSYELCVLKKYALEMLQKVKSDNQYFIQANRLVKFLKYFKDIDDKFIPCNSIIREFIGGSMFYDN